MYDQLPRRDIDKDNKQQLFQFIRENQSGILLILDGLDKLSSSKFTIFLRINWRKSTPQMPQTCNSKARGLKRGEKMLLTRCFRSKDSLKTM